MSVCTEDFPEGSGIKNSSRSFWSSSVNSSGREESATGKEASIPADTTETTGGEQGRAGDGSPRYTTGEEAAEGTKAGLTGLFRYS